MYRTTLVAVNLAGELIKASVAVFNIEFTQEGSIWVGVCQELGTSAYGPTLEQAKAEVGDAVMLQLNEVERLGFTYEFLKEHGVTFAPLPSPGSKPPAEHWQQALLAA